MASASRKPRPSAGMLERWARFSYHHRWPVIGAWVLALVGLLAANFMFSGEYSSAFRVPGSESQKAGDLLEDRFPARGGDSADLVFEAPGGVASAGRTRPASRRSSTRYDESMGSSASTRRLAMTRA